jgi:hypothetical protein
MFFRIMSFLVFLVVEASTTTVINTKCSLLNAFGCSDLLTNSSCTDCFGAPNTLLNMVGAGCLDPTAVPAECSASKY